MVAELPLYVLYRPHQRLLISYVVDGMYYVEVAFVVVEVLFENAVVVVDDVVVADNY